MRPGQDFYIALIQNISRAFWKHKEQMSYTDQSFFTVYGLHTQTKPNTRYFRQYRNPGQDASGKNGTYGHPSLWVGFNLRFSSSSPDDYFVYCFSYDVSFSISQCQRHRWRTANTSWQSVCCLSLSLTHTRTRTRAHAHTHTHTPSHHCRVCTNTLFCKLVI